ncbi:MAG: META domain-containing protein [Methanomicrobiaceae archaeon]|nr:META domain-containing protein [Methanomicrobiaceae archaeon]
MTGEGPVYVPEGVEADLECINPCLVGGSAGCNDYSAPYFLDDGEISIGIPTRTCIACLDERKMEVEDLFLKHLSNVSQAYLMDEKLVFAGSDGEEMLVFVDSGEKHEMLHPGYMAGPGDVLGCTWHLYADPDRSSIEVEEIPEGADVTLTFGGDGRLYGSSGCNNYFADYTLEKGRLEIGMIGSTLMACADSDLMVLESKYLTKLDQIEAAYVDGDSLFLMNENGVAILSFMKASTSPEGIEWTLISYNNGVGELVSVPADTEITLKLEEGRAGGNSGCNSYFGDYEMDDMGSLAFGMIGMTEMYCEGRMDMESRYLTLLGETAGYSMSDGVLNLMDTYGNRILVFSGE